MANGQSTAAWGKQQLRNVSAEGVKISRIRLIACEATWNTWHPESWAPSHGSGETPDQAIERWALEVDNTIAALADEWPTKQISVQIVGENDNLEVVAQCLKSIRGRNKEATSKVFGSDSKALADSMDAQARTMERILASAASQVEMSHNSAKLVMQQNEALMTFHLAEKEAALIRMQEAEENRPSETTKLFEQQLVTQLPALLELGFLFLKTRMGGASGAESVAQVVKSAASLSGAPVDEIVQ